MQRLSCLVYLRLTLLIEESDCPPLFFSVYRFIPVHCLIFRSHLICSSPLFAYVLFLITRFLLAAGFCSERVLYLAILSVDLK